VEYEAQHVWRVDSVKWTTASTQYVTLRVSSEKELVHLQYNPDEHVRSGYKSAGLWVSCGQGSATMAILARTHAWV